MVISFGIPLYAKSISTRGIEFSLLGAFFSVYALLLGAAAFHYGEGMEVMLGPLGSPERRAKVKKYMIVFAAPALAVAGILYYLITLRGFSVF